MHAIFANQSLRTLTDKMHRFAPDTPGRPITAVLYTVLPVYREKIVT